MKQQDSHFWPIKELRSWRSSSAERQFVDRVLSSNLLSAEDRLNLAHYHATTFFRLASAGKFYTDLSNCPVPADDSLESWFDIHHNLSGLLIASWASLDALAQEINLICYRLAPDERFYHPVIDERKVCFYMVRLKLLRSRSLNSSPITVLLNRETKDRATARKQYLDLSRLHHAGLSRLPAIGRIVPEPVRAIESDIIRIGDCSVYLSDSRGPSLNTSEEYACGCDLELNSTCEEILKWLGDFLDESYRALSSMIAG